MNILYKLPQNQQHTSCPRCNYVGCNFARRRHPRVGHWLWAADYYSGKYSPIKAVKRLIFRLTDFDYSKIENIELEDINHGDAPDYCDAFIGAATYKDKPMSDKQLDRLNENRDFVAASLERELY
jgi:hypothetical protein